jgi:phytanoyl-CoA hydroxylase
MFLRYARTVVTHVRPSTQHTRLLTTPAFTQKDVDFFHENGYLHLRDVIPREHIEGMKSECDAMVNSYDFEKHQQSVFTTINQKTDDYFLRSGSKVSFFFEEDAFDKDGKLAVPVDRAFNKIGHAMHIHKPAFKAYAHQQLFKDLLGAIGYKKPLIAQSMYIFKQPKIGGEVSPHQDSSFLHTSPLSCIGLWAPMQPANQVNGCLWAIPGSHRKGIHGDRRMVRCVDPRDPWHVTTMLTAPIVQYNEADFVPIEMEVGSVLVIHGELVHASKHNYSSLPRNAVTLHCIEGEGAVYDHLNWLQPEKEFPFPQV